MERASFRPLVRSASSGGAAREPKTGTRRHPLARVSMPAVTTEPQDDQLDRSRDVGDQSSLNDSRQDAVLGEALIIRDSHHVDVLQGPRAAPRARTHAVQQ
jgi:hypothetical protein